MPELSLAWVGKLSSQTSADRQEGAGEQHEGEKECIVTNECACVSSAQSSLHSSRACREAMLNPVYGACKTFGDCAKGSSFFLCRSMSRVAASTTRAHEVGEGASPPLVLPALPDHVGDAVLALKKGLVIAVPTDTLYGFAADACSEEAIKKIYSIKGRNSMNPLAVCLAHPDDFEKYSVTKYLPEGLLKELFPGPVTGVLLRGEHSLLSKSLNPGLGSIGIRIPDSAFIVQVAAAFGGALALTSANVSGQSSTIQIHEFKSLWPYCAAVFDAGELPSTREGSTIVDLTVPGVFKILRTGSALDSTVAVLKKHGLTDTMLYV